MPLLREFLTAGRIGRFGFWMRHLLVLPAALFLCIATETMLGRPAGLVAAALTTLFLISTWGRRLHDRGRSAWWLLLTALPVLGAAFLFVECGLLGIGHGAERFGRSPIRTHGYVTV